MLEETEEDLDVPENRGSCCTWSYWGFAEVGVASEVVEKKENTDRSDWIETLFRRKVEMDPSSGSAGSSSSPSYSLYSTAFSPTSRTIEVIYRNDGVDGNE